jgi:hypothetical protein
MDEQVTVPEAQPVNTGNDPFSLDENSLASLNPEQRASLDPIIDTWRKKAGEEISRRDSEIEKYKAYGEKATALDKLTQYQPFVQWWQQQANQAKQGANSSQQQAIGETKPTDIASNQEWQDALSEASYGDSSKLQRLQARMMATWATPLVTELREKQESLDTKIEMRNLFENHPDAKELDSIGVDPKSKEGTSLLEMCLENAKSNGKSLEEGYKMAKRWFDSMSVMEKQKAMGMVTEKKQTVTQGNSTSSSNHSLTEVDNIDDMLKRSMEATLAGDSSARFVVRK